MINLFSKKTKDKIHKYNFDIEWNIPGLFVFDYSVCYAISTLKEIGIDIPKINLYGSPRCVWQGGRGSFVRHELSDKQIERGLSYVKNHGLTPTFTFTRYNFEESYLKDSYANLILDIALEQQSRFIVANNLLREHIKSKKENAVIISSILQPIFEFQQPHNLGKVSFEEETEFYNELLKKYDVVVVRPEYSLKINKSNYKLISDISRIEVLINQLCGFNCPKAIAHYSNLENEELSKESSTNFKCAQYNTPLKEIIKNSTIHPKSKVQELLKLGVKHLKVHGRATSLDYHAQPFLILKEIFENDSVEINLAGQCIAQKENMNEAISLFTKYINEC